MLVSILINNYNNAPYLDFCVQSALNQSYTNIEIIVYDDGSTDNSMEILRRYNDKIQVVTTGKNFGVSHVFNQGHAISEAFKVSKGEIICLLDGDDAFLPHKVATIVAAFQQNPKAVLAQHIFYEIDTSNEKTGKTRPKIIVPKENYLDFILKTHCLVGLFTPTSALSFRRDVLEKMMPYPEKDKWIHLCPDVRLSREACFYGDIITLTEPLGLFRVHNNSYSHHWYPNKAYLNEFVVQLYDYFNTILVKNIPHTKISYQKYRLKKLFNPIFWR
jgi:glycosyltransferase involved in cell wall biosynthesis